MDYWKPYQNIKKYINKNVLCDYLVIIPIEIIPIDMPKFGNVKGNAIIHLILDVKFPTPTPKKWSQTIVQFKYMLYLDKRFNMTFKKNLMGNSIYPKP